MDPIRPVGHEAAPPIPPVKRRVLEEEERREREERRRRRHDQAEVADEGLADGDEGEGPHIDIRV